MDRHVLPLPDAVAELAQRQHGVIAVWQLRELGVGMPQQRALLQRRSLIAELPRVLAINGAPRSVNRSRRAGLLSLGAGAVTSFAAAAHIHGFDRSDPDAVEFTVPRAQRNARLPFRVHSTTRLPPIDRVEVDGWPCTSATRTVIDLAATRINRFQLEAAIDSAVRSGASSPMLLAQRLAALRGRGRYGVRRLDRLLIDTGGHTMLERRFLALVRQAGLPPPAPQVVFQRSGRAYARVDFYWHEARIVVEVSGRKGHSSPSERARDAQRRNELLDAGMLVYEYTWEDVTARPWMVQRTMRQRYEFALRRRSA